jgi:pimeloyl-ACP methyl ester carboxylesterase
MPAADIGEVTLHYQVNGTGPLVLGIVGFALHHRFWASATPAVTDADRSFVTFDNRGMGRSIGPPPASIEQMADDFGPPAGSSQHRQGGRVRGLDGGRSPSGSPSTTRT